MSEPAIFGSGKVNDAKARSPVPAIESVFARVKKRADLFGTQRERNAVYTGAADAMGQHFIGVFLPRRIDRAYASSVLGYNIGGKIPFVDSGETMETVFQRAKSEARMAQGGRGPYVLIRLMAPAKVNQYPDVLRGLQTIAPSEVAELANVFQIEAAVISNGADRRRIKRGATAGQLRLSMRKTTTAADTAADTYRRARLNKTAGLDTIGGQRNAALTRLQKIINPQRN